MFNARNWILGNGGSVASAFIKPFFPFKKYVQHSFVEHTGITCPNSEHLTKDQYYPLAYGLLNAPRLLVARLFWAFKS
jgi:hypothetical protein